MSLLSSRRHAWLVASALGGVFIAGFGYVRHYFEGEWRWFAVTAAVVCWLVISAAVWIAAKEDAEKTAAKELLKKEFRKRNWWK